MREDSGAMFSCTSTMDSYHDHDDLNDDVSDDLMSGGNQKPDAKKSNKPIMEKRRRARINSCLNELKGILLEAMRKDPARHSKLEKADILELTVRHLQNIQRNQLAVAMATDPTVLYRFKNGFSECASEVSKYLSKLDNVEEGMKSRVASHLTSCVSGLQQVNPPVGMGVGVGVGVGGFSSPASRYHIGVGPGSGPGGDFMSPPQLPQGLFSPPTHGLIPASNLTPPGDLNNNKEQVIHRPMPLPAFNIKHGGMTTTTLTSIKPPLSSPESPINYSVPTREREIRNERQQGVRVKVEPITPPTSTPNTKDSMWRPW